MSTAPSARWSPSTVTARAATASSPTTRTSGTGAACSASWTSTAPRLLHDVAEELALGHRQRDVDRPGRAHVALALAATGARLARALRVAAFLAGAFFTGALRAAAFTGTLGGAKGLRGLRPTTRPSTSLRA